MAEAHGEGRGLELDEFLRTVFAFARRVLGAGPQVLADREDVDAVRAHVLEYRQQLLCGLAESDHDAGLGDHVRSQLLDISEQRQAVRVHRFGTNARVEAGHGLGVVVEDVRARLDHGADRLAVALEVGRQHLDGGTGAAPADGANGAREYPGAAVAQVVAVDAGDDRMAQAELRHRLGHAQRLTEVELHRASGGDRAKAAGARAGVAQDHEGRRAPVPAVEDVGAAGLLANRVQALFAHELLELLVILTLVHAHADPFRKPAGGIDDLNHDAVPTNAGWRGSSPPGAP